MTKVLIVDDHAVVRAGVRQILAAHDGFQCGEAATAAQAFAQLQKEQWDVMVLDLHLPDKTGIDVLELMTTLHPTVAVLVFSMSPAERYALQVMHAGAKSYLQKDAAPDELVTAIRTVATGVKHLPDDLLDVLLAPGEATDSARHSVLSNSEREIFQKICEGKTLTSIGKEMGLTLKTVSRNRIAILQKMNMQSNADLICYAYKQNLIPHQTE